jgi:hypothetical protein
MAVEHDTEITREFSQVGYFRVRPCELDEMLRQWSSAGSEILYVLALRMRRRHEQWCCVRRHPHQRRSRVVGVLQIVLAGMIVAVDAR